MKQLLIANGITASGSADNLSALPAGKIAFFTLSDRANLSTYPTENFGIALGRGNNSPAFVIPEVDLETLSVVKCSPSNGQTFKATFTVPSDVAPGTYTLVLIKKGTVPHERNTWTATVTIPAGDETTTANDVAAEFRSRFAAMADAGLDITVTGVTNYITIEGNNRRENWVLKGADALTNVAPTSTRSAEAPVGDKEYVKNLASQCAAGKGFNYVEGSGREIYPGYPEDNTDNPYTIYTLRFKVGRASSKTRDERVWQLVHIAAGGAGTTLYDTLDAILFKSEEDESSSSSSAAAESASVDNP